MRKLFMPLRPPQDLQRFASQAVGEGILNETEMQALQSLYLPRNNVEVYKPTPKEQP